MNYRKSLGALVGLMAAVAFALPARAQNTDCLSFTRSYAPAAYVPGSNLTVTVSFTESCTEIIAALGLVETIPPGWLFISAGGPTPPDTRPDAGDTGALEFSWISSSLPFSFTYTIRPPAGETGDHILAGTAEYRVGTGTAQFFGPVQTELEDGLVECVDEPGCVSATRSTGNQFYPPGAALQVTVSLLESCTSPLQELTVTETIPEGWTFVRAGGNIVPTDQPDPGAGGTLTFGWLDVPAIPNSFTYTVAVPGNQSGAKTITGAVAWRTCDATLDGTIPPTTLTESESPLQQCIAQCGTSAIDGDGDRLNDCVEDCLGTEADNPDSDGDGIPDGDEAFVGLNPLDVTDAAQDLDEDGDSNLREFLNRTGINNVNDPAPTFYLDAQNGSDSQGNGSADVPWASITHALQQLDSKGTGPARLLLNAGIYTGNVTLREDVALIGLAPCPLGTISGCAGIVGAIEGAEGAELRNLVLTVPDVDPDAALLTLENVAMRLEAVQFVGTPDLLNIGILALGEGPGRAEVFACRFQQLNIGIDIRGCHPKVFGSTFLDHATAYMLFEDIGEGGPCGGSLGVANDANTGWNRFVESMGLSIINQHDEVIVMERNDWDTNSADFIAARIGGGIDFEPFLAAGSNLLAASFFATVTNEANNQPIANATVNLGAGLSSVTENNEGVYAFSLVPEGSYTVTVSAPGFATEAMPIFINRGGIFNGVFTLEAEGSPEGEGEGDGEGGAEGEGEGEGEGEPTPPPGGCECPQPGKAVPIKPDAGSIAVAMLTFLALATATGMQRRMHMLGAISRR